MTDKPATSYMDLNTPEQRAEAAKFLRRNWSDEAREALTKYYRDTQGGPALKAFESELIDIIGYAPSILLDVQRELGRITIDYGRDHHLDLDIQVSGGFFRKYGTVQFALESNGVPSQFIDIHGNIHDGEKLFSDVGHFIEWYVALRCFYFHVRDHRPISEYFEINVKAFHGLLVDFSVLVTTLLLSTKPNASDAKNLLWANKDTQLAVNFIANGRAQVYLYTTKSEAVDLLMSWRAEHGY